MRLTEDVGRRLGGLGPPSLIESCPRPVHDQVEPPQLEPVLGAVLDPSVEPLDEREVAAP